MQSDVELVLPMFFNFLIIRRLKKSSSRLRRTGDLSCLVDYYDKLSKLLDAIRALNVASRELQGRY